MFIDAGVEPFLHVLVELRERNVVSKAVQSLDKLSAKFGLVKLDALTSLAEPTQVSRGHG